MSSTSVDENTPPSCSFQSVDRTPECSAIQHMKVDQEIVMEEVWLVDLEETNAQVRSSPKRLLSRPVLRRKSPEKIKTKLFCCPKCSFCARLPSDFSPHILSHETVPPFCCSACGVRKRFKSSVKGHIKEEKSKGDMKHFDAYCILTQPVTKDGFASYLRWVSVSKKFRSGRISRDDEAMVLSTPVVILSEEEEEEDQIGNKPLDLESKSWSRNSGQQSCDPDESVVESERYRTDAELHLSSSDRRMFMVIGTPTSSDNDKENCLKRMEVLEKEINDGLRTLKDIQLREQERQEIDAKRAACRELEAEYQHAKMETNRLEKELRKAQEASRMLCGEDAFKSGGENTQNPEVDLTSVNPDQLNDEYAKSKENQTRLALLLETSTKELIVTESEWKIRCLQVQELKCALEMKVEEHASCEKELARMMYLKCKARVEKNGNSLSNVVDQSDIETHSQSKKW